MQAKTETPPAATPPPEPTCPDCGALVKYTVKPSQQVSDGNRHFGVWMRCDAPGCVFAVHINAMSKDGWKCEWAALSAVIVAAREQMLKERAAKEAEEKAREETEAREFSEHPLHGKIHKFQNGEMYNGCIWWKGFFWPLAVGDTRALSNGAQFEQWDGAAWIVVQPGTKAPVGGYSFLPHEVCRRFDREGVIYFNRVLGPPAAREPNRPGATIDPYREAEGLKP